MTKNRQFKMHFTEEELKEEHDKTIEQLTNLAFESLYIAKSKISNKEYEEALEFLDSSSDSYSRVHEYYFDKWKEAADKGENEEAKEFLDKYTELESSLSADINFNIGLCFEFLAETTEISQNNEELARYLDTALMYFDITLISNEENIMANYHISKIHNNLSNTEKAKDYFEKAMNKEKEETKIHNVEELLYIYDLANIIFYSDNHDQVLGEGVFPNS